MSAYVDACELFVEVLPGARIHREWSPKPLPNVLFSIFIFWSLSILLIFDCIPDIHRTLTKVWWLKPCQQRYARAYNFYSVTCCFTPPPADSTNICRNFDRLFSFFLYPGYTHNFDESPGGSNHANKDMHVLMISVVSHAASQRRQQTRKINAGVSTDFAIFCGIPDIHITLTKIRVAQTMPKRYALAYEFCSRAGWHHRRQTHRIYAGICTALPFSFVSRIYT